MSDIQRSEVANETVHDWWERQHRDQHPGWLSSTPPDYVWTKLNVLDRLMPGSVVLNIDLLSHLHANPNCPLALDQPRPNA